MGLSGGRGGQVFMLCPCAEVLAVWERRGSAVRAPHATDQLLGAAALLLSDLVKHFPQGFQNLWFAGHRHTWEHDCRTYRMLSLVSGHDNAPLLLPFPRPPPLLSSFPAPKDLTRFPGDCSGGCSLWVLSATDGMVPNSIRRRALFLKGAMRSIAAGCRP